MKVLSKQKSEPGIWMDEHPFPGSPPAGSVTIKIRKTAICGTDVHIYQWDEWSQKTIPVPLVIGHEFVGTIHEVGLGVEGLAVGERVSGEGHLACGTCRNCRTGTAHLCDKTIGVGINRSGAFSEFLTIPASNVIPIPDSVSDDMAAILDPFGNAVHSTLSCDLVGKQVLITGAGPIGLMSTAIAKRAGARQVVITDTNEKRLAMARELGADLAVNIAEHSLEEACQQAELSQDFSVGLEMSGSPNAYHTLIKHLRPGSHIAMLGLMPDGSGLPWSEVIFKGLTLKGIYGREMYKTWVQGFDLLEGGLDVSSVITHHFPVSEYQAAFETAASGSAGKVILSWQDS